jgi:hypothetical protein
LGEIPGSARLVLVEGVLHLNEPQAVFEAMLEGWARQQRSRLLGDATISQRDRLVRRFTVFAEALPWEWNASDVEEFTVSLTSGRGRLAHSTIRSYHLALRMFCEYLTDARYEWLRQCRDRFGQLPTQVCHEWNTVAHLNEYEGRPQITTAGRTDGRTVDAVAVDLAILESAANGVALDTGQAGLVRSMASSGARLQLAIAPAGAGKTTALRTLTHAWLEGGGQVLGLAPSAAAAAQLRDHTRAPTDTLAKLTWSLHRPDGPAGSCRTGRRILARRRWY